MLVVFTCSGQPYHKMDHLACFAPAMLALGAKYGAVTGAKADQYMLLARNLTETCYQMYARQPTGEMRCMGISSWDKSPAHQQC